MFPDQQGVRVFHSAHELANYTRGGNVFPLKKAKESPILKWMLIKL